MSIPCSRQKVLKSTKVLIMTPVMDKFADFDVILPVPVNRLWLWDLWHNNATLFVSFYLLKITLVLSEKLLALSTNKATDTFQFARLRKCARRVHCNHVSWHSDALSDNLLLSMRKAGNEIQHTRRVYILVVLGGVSTNWVVPKDCSRRFTARRHKNNKKHLLV